MSRRPFDPTRVQVPPEERSEDGRGALLTVTQLTQVVKRAIERHVPRTVHVVGEISNYKRHSSGHVYFVMKDEHCEVSCVMWRSDAGRLKFDPGDGLEVLATGTIDVFERSGRYQLYVRRLEPKGVGALELAFRQLREKLEKEGLFDPSRKKAPPRFPRRIAVVTSPTGAAIRDILQTLKRRWPAVEVYVYPVMVQGPTAAGEIAEAMRMLNANSASLGGIDCMIVGRGGGSLEDLWAFNEEVVARAIHASEIPVISAVGHEADVSISDLVADVRAATPTAAAEIAVPLRAEVSAQVETAAGHLGRLVGHVVALRRARLAGLTQRACFREPLTPVRRREQAVDELVTRVQRAVLEILHRHHRRLSVVEVTLGRIRPDVFAARQREKLLEVGNRLRWVSSRRVVIGERLLAALRERLAGAAPVHRLERMQDLVKSMAVRLDAISHKRTLRRGFTITRRKKGRAVVRKPGQLVDGETIVTETAEGKFESRVINLKQMELFD